MAPLALVECIFIAPLALSNEEGGGGGGGECERIFFLLETPMLRLTNVQNLLRWPSR